MFMLRLVLFCSISFLIFLAMAFHSSRSAQGTGDRTFLALGDSYTIGEDVDLADSWPYQLRAALKKEGFSIGPPTVIARTGWRTDNLIAAIAEAQPDTKYDLVSVQIGVNNQFQGKAIEAYKKDLRALFNTAITLCSQGRKGVFVLSIPDYGSTPFGKIERQEIGKEIDLWNTACKEICDEFELPFYDITPISKKGATDNSLVAKDGLHPSGKMYALWVAAIIEPVSKLLQ
jgi:acyl-CoA thioesterase I